MRDPWQVLGVPPSATYDEARHAYRIRSQLLHPDRHQGAGQEVLKEAERAFRELEGAWASVKVGLSTGWDVSGGASEPTGSAQENVSPPGPTSPPDPVDQEQARQAALAPLLHVGEVVEADGDGVCLEFEADGNGNGLLALTDQRLIFLPHVEPTKRLAISYFDLVDTLSWPYSGAYRVTCVAVLMAEGGRFTFATNRKLAKSLKRAVQESVEKGAGRLTGPRSRGHRP